jgi:DNA-binding transcriptional ArsR family regulator
MHARRPCSPGRRIELGYWDPRIGIRELGTAYWAVPRDDVPSDIHRDNVCGDNRRRGGVRRDDDRVFKALADPTRRLLLDRLFERDGRTLTELESELEMTRFGVAKHLRVLEEANLVITRRSSREKLHFLNPVPIRLIHDRWIDKYTQGPASMWPT